MPDCDVFSSAGRWGRAAAATLAGALPDEGADLGNEAPPDLWTQLERHLNVAMKAADGLGMLSGLLSMLKQQQAAKIQLSFLTDQTMEGRLLQIERLERADGHSALDMYLSRAARREILHGRLDAPAIVRNFVIDYCLGTIVYGRRGMIETHGAAWVDRQVESVRSQLTPFSVAAASELLARPDARLLRVEAPAGVPPFDALTTNLLGVCA